MLLYKFCPPKRIDVLISGKIVFSRTRTFNDPFEGAPSCEYLWDPGIHPNQNDWGARLKRGVHAVYKGWGALDKVTQDTLILSLAARRDSALLWAHYAASHRGFAIGLKSDHDWFKQSPSRELIQVVYSEKRPSRRILTELTYTDVFATKSNEWAYEQEWRVIDHISAASSHGIKEAPDCFLFELAPSAVSEVILGCRASKTLGLRIRRLLSYEPYCHVNFYTAKPDERSFSLNFERVRFTRHRSRKQTKSKGRLLSLKHRAG